MPADIGNILERELGAKSVLRAGDERLQDYGRDESHLGFFPADCAALCESREQVASVLRLAAEHGVPVTPRGAGSGMAGGCLPVRGGVVLSTERMRRVLEIDPDDLVTVVEPGVITGELQTAVEDQGLFYPPDPASLEVCSIGGNVSTNAGGPRAFKYGVTREYVLGLEVGLIGGELLRAGRRSVKGVTGYDVVAGFVGSEGTFGVVTEITLKLLPKPAAVSTILAVFPDTAAAGAAVTAILGKGFRPRTLELADRAAIDHVRSRSRYRFPAEAGAITLLEIDGQPDALEPAIIRLGELCESNRAIDVLVAMDSQEQRSMWDARRAISKALREAHVHKVGEDICVPRGAIVEMLRRIDEIGARFDIAMATFGHAGDGNLHVNFLLDDDPAEPAVGARLSSALEALFRATIELRGTLSGEHGIGSAKRDFMHLEQSESLLEYQRRWKALWDPRNLLNPGKILPAGAQPCHE